MRHNRHIADRAIGKGLTGRRKKIRRSTSRNRVAAQNQNRSQERDEQSLGSNLLI